MCIWPSTITRTDLKKEQITKNTVAPNKRASEHAGSPFLESDVEW